MQNQRLVTLAEVSRAISASLDAEDVLERVCSAVGAFFFEAPTEAEVWLRSGRGFVPFRTQLGGGEATPRMPDKLVAQMIKKRVPVQNGAGRRGRRLVVPLIVNRFIEGYLDVRCRRRSRLTDDEMQVVEILVGHAAVALENAQNYGKLESMYLETVRALAAAIEAKDHYTAEHGDMLANMAIAVGRRLGLDDRALRDVQYAAVLHDIGKIGIPGRHPQQARQAHRRGVRRDGRAHHHRRAHHQPHRLPGADRRHDPLGARALGRARLPGQAATASEIPLASRILLVCDAFHAMTSDRPYRKAMPEEEAIEELRRNAGAQFDPVVVGAFLEAWPDFEGSDLAAVRAGPSAPRAVSRTGSPAAARRGGSAYAPTLAPSRRVVLVTSCEEDRDDRRRCGATSSTSSRRKASRRASSPSSGSTRSRRAPTTAMTEAGFAPEVVARIDADFATGLPGRAAPGALGAHRGRRAAAHAGEPDLARRDAHGDRTAALRRLLRGPAGDRRQGR